MSQLDATSAFDRGQKAGNESLALKVENPFAAGTAEHNNFEVGRRFGVANSEARARHAERSPVITSGEES